VRRKTFVQFCALAAAAWLLVPAISEAHAILLESTPAANSTVHGPELAIRLRFNSRIDAGRSQISLVRPDGASATLKLQEQSSPDTLSCVAGGLQPGAHRIRWQVLAADGHITRGEIPFTVAQN